MHATTIAVGASASARFAVASAVRQRNGLALARPMRHRAINTMLGPIFLFALVILDAALLLIGAAAMWWGWRHLHADQRCSCGYDPRGATTDLGLCPECGRQPRDITTTDWRRADAIRTTGAIFVLVGLALAPFAIGVVLDAVT